MRARRVLIACLPVAVLAVAVLASSMTGRGALASTPRHGVRLVLAHSAYRAGQPIAITIVNDTSSLILHGGCFTLQRQDADAEGWVTVASTHGIRLPCLATDSIPQPAGTSVEDLPLYDDLLPGNYRITLRYKPAHRMDIGRLSGPHVRSVQARLKVLAYRPGPRPSLNEQRILALAEQAASGSGDPKPTLIQHAAGTHFDAVRICCGDLVFEWNWSYLIAVRGHFTEFGAPIPPGAKPPTGTVITLVVDARTGQVTDDGVSNRYPPLAELAPVTTDRRAPA
jgi:hypothetical protein